MRLCPEMHVVSFTPNCNIQPEVSRNAKYFPPEAHDLEALNCGSELRFFDFKNFLIWM